MVGKKGAFFNREDLCAAQIAQGPDGLYLWGWIIENWQGGIWGGHLSLPYRVTQGTDGLLYTQLDPEVGGAVRGYIPTGAKMPGRDRR